MRARTHNVKTMKKEIPLHALQSLALLIDLTGRADHSPAEIRDVVADEYLADHQRAQLLDFASAKETWMAKNQ